MKHALIALFFLTAGSVFGQASVAYYPFNDLVTVSTNADRVLWLDARVQTNTVFGSLTTTLCPLVNVVRKPQVNYYTGLGVRFNPLNPIDNRSALVGYSLHVGVRARVPFLPKLRVAFEIAPYARQDFKTGNLQSLLGLVYQFEKKG